MSVMSVEKAPISSGFLLPKNDICNMGELVIFLIYLHVVVIILIFAYCKN
jgi:hypothetical protein